MVELPSLVVKSQDIQLFLPVAILQPPFHLITSPSMAASHTAPGAKAYIS